MSYSPPLAATLSGATVRQLAYWRRVGPQGALFQPEYGSRPRVTYSYRDIVALRMFVRLRGDLPLQRVRRVVAWLEEHHPDTHLSAHRVRAIPGAQTAVWISPEGDYIDVVDRPGQGELKVVMDDVFDSFETRKGRWVPALAEPAEGVTVDPGVRSGYPVIEGTRIPYNVIAGLSADGLDPSEIAKLYPAITAREVEGAVALAGLVAQNVG